MRWVVATSVLVVLLAWSAVPAHADGAPIASYEVTVTLTEDGAARVVIDMTMDFSAERGRGPYLTLPKRQADATNPDEWYVFDYDAISISSPSGAEDAADISETDSTLTIRIGDENVFYESAQRYRISYVVRGLIVPNHPESGLDEFNWNVIGDAWESSIGSVEVRVTGPVEVAKTACFYGPDFQQPCAARSDGATATYQVTSLRAHEPMQVVAGFPAGTFPEVKPMKAERHPPFSLEPVPLGIVGTLSAGAVGLVYGLNRRHARDKRYLEMSPGMVPSAWQRPRIGTATSNQPPPMRFEPPIGVSPGEIGLLTDTRADNIDISATIIDLAVRGYLRIDSAPAGDTLVSLRQPQAGLKPFEAELLQGLFAHGDRVTTAQLRDEKYAGTIAKVREALTEAGVQRGWFSARPNKRHATAFWSGTFSTAGGFAASSVGAGSGWGLIGVPLILFGVGMMATAHRFRSRTALGSAYLEQSRGFEQYLRTIQADHISYSSDDDLFSRYLPYAMVFGLTKRWAEVFAHSHSQGQLPNGDLNWFPGQSYDQPLLFAAALWRVHENFDTSMKAADQAASASSGSSGFSGGGGLGGGGGGSW